MLGTGYRLQEHCGLRSPRSGVRGGHNPRACYRNTTAITRHQFLQFRDRFKLEKAWPEKSLPPASQNHVIYALP